MTKSTPSTSTQTVSNPVGQLQAGYLGGLWDQASRMGGVGGPETAYGFEYLDRLRNYAGNQFNNLQGDAQNLVPGGMDFVNAALRGNAGGYQPAASQIADLNGIASGAPAVGQGFANNLTGAAFAAPGTVSPYTGALTSLAGQYGGLTGAGYGSFGALNNFGNQAAAAGQGTGGALMGLSGAAMGAANPSINALYANAGMGISGNPIYDSLTGMARGDYVDPSRNPALAGTISAATDPLVRQYQTAVAPQTDSNFSLGGRYGSGAWTNAVGNNQTALGRAIGDATSSIVNNAYNTGLNSMLGAGTALGSAYNTGVGNVTGALSNAGQLAQSGVTNAGQLIGAGGQALQTGYGNAGSMYGAGASALNSLAGTGLGGASSNYSTGGQLSLSALNSMMQGLNYGAGAANAGYGTGATALAQGGNLANSGLLNLGGIAQMTPDLANYPLSQLSTAYNSGWAPIQNYGALLGQPLGGNTVTQQTQPYYSNVGSSLLSGLTGIAALASKI